MAAVTYPLTCAQNEDFYLPMTYRQRNADGTPGPIINLAGYSAKMTVEPVGGGAPLVAMTTTNGLIVISSGLVSPNIELFIPRATSETFPLIGCKYDLVLISGDGHWHPFLAGPFVIQEGISS
jgi:hypothetical protein